MKLLLALLAMVAGAFLRADIDELEETPKYWLKFDGNLDSSGASGFTWGGENDASYTADCSGVETDQAYVIKDGFHPWAKNNLDLGSGDWTIQTRCKIVNDANCVVWGLGSSANNTVLALITKGASSIGITQRKKDGTYTEFKPLKIPSATESYHTYALIAEKSMGTLSIAVDGVKMWTSTFDFSSLTPSFQLGSCHSGANNIDLNKGIGIAISDFRVYQRALTEENLKTISAGETMAVYPSVEVSTLHAQVTGEASWGGLFWYTDATFQTLSETAPTAETAVRLALSADASLVMNDDAAYSSLFVTAAAGASSPKLTFLKPKAIISSLPTTVGELSDEIPVLTVIPAVIGGASYRSRD